MTTKKKKPDLASVFEGSAETIVSDSPAYSESEERKAGKPKRVSSTYYIPEEDHYRLKELALHQRCRVNDLVMEGLNMMLAKYGQPAIKNSK